METEVLSPVQSATRSRSAVITPRTPVRVLLVSDHRLLRDALARALKSQADISLVGAHESSRGITPEMIDSTCDVLLLDPVNSVVDTQVLDHLEDRFSSLRIVMIDREAKIADVISAILSGSRTCRDLGNPHL
jgi:DNA-binding NarL/FixJ family response regulator